MHDSWYKNAIFYSLDVETFYDSNGDGIGDFQGLIQKLETIAGLGFSCIWLLPFYPSPNRDNGYDVTDYYNVDARLGDLGDFAQFLDKAEQLGLRVIIDLVVNHTSIEHPWFRQARKDPESPFRDYYVWSDEPLAYEKDHLMFQGEEDTIWSYDEKAGQYYLHRFYKEQPDLNIANPSVQQEILKIMTFWLRLGVHGFRIDAAEMLVEPYGLKGKDKEELMSFIDDMRAHTQRQGKEVLLLAEVNAGPDSMGTYIGDGKRVHMLFNFFLNQHLFLSLADENKSHLEKALKTLSPIAATSQYLNFLRHHDELNLKLLSAKDQQKVFDAFAPEKDMRIYGFGIRRRLAPMLGGDMQRLKLAYSLLFALPGAPLIRYGDATGMGENLALPGRTSVRTPMQWSPEKNAGFSTADSRKLVHPVISKGPFSFKEVNVMSAQQQPLSLLNWVERLIATRRQCPEIGNGELFIIPQKDARVLAHGFRWEEKKLVFLHNLSSQPIQISIHTLHVGKLYDVFAENLYDEKEGVVQLPAYGYHWLRVA